MSNWAENRRISESSVLPLTSRMLTTIKWSFARSLLIMILFLKFLLISSTFRPSLNEFIALKSWRITYLSVTSNTLLNSGHIASLCFQSRVKITQFTKREKGRGITSQNMWPSQRKILQLSNSGSPLLPVFHYLFFWEAVIKNLSLFKVLPGLGAVRNKCLLNRPKT